MTGSLVPVQIWALVKLFVTYFTLERLYPIMDPLVNLQVIFRAEQLPTVHANLKWFYCSQSTNLKQQYHSQFIDIQVDHNQLHMIFCVCSDLMMFEKTCYKLHK